MLHVLVVGAGGFLGSVARFGATLLVQRWAGRAFPYGTLAVNVAGCLLIGAAMALVERRPAFDERTRLFVTSGLLGGFTTFSALGYETLELARLGRYGAAGLNVAANVVLGLAAVWAGRALVRGLAGA